MALAFLGALCSYALLDFLWVGVIAHPFYVRHLGHLMAKSVSWPPVVAFYPLYAAGVVFFAAQPGIEAESLRIAAMRGAGLGLLVYGTYNLVNAALLKDWAAVIVAADIAWGIFITAVAASAAYGAASFSR